MTPRPAPGAGQAARLVRRGFWLEYASMAWMTAEAAVAITAGVAAGSTALAGFGLDSVIEFAAAGIVVWQLRGQGRQTRAVRLIGVTFFVLALYLAIEGVHDLVSHARPGHPAAGLAVAAAALVVMPGLAVAKRRTGQALGNKTLIADSAETAFCAFTSAATLLGTGLNAGLGWWWADPTAALVIAALAVKEGLEAWEEEEDAEDGHHGAPDHR
jgi:divalent metal cation (Fe/Co/Zn/Cd) transporter